ncbi:MAG: phosphodiesterase [Deltaproteobacteria bacterium ADurb.Bin510]|nr:MAG: phosphodiesterase [Deltaproteobacteria bacterium ADurb.Bin510]
MSAADQLDILEIELKKAASLGGSLALVVVPERHAERVLGLKRDLDTVASFMDYSVVAMFGATAEDAAAHFIALPKGVAVYPGDAADLKGLLYLALERLRCLENVPGVRQLWDNLSVAGAREKKLRPEDRFISASFYQFYLFICMQPSEMHSLLDGLDRFERDWIIDLLPEAILNQGAAGVRQAPAEAARILVDWEYSRRFAEKVDLGSATLRRFRNTETLFTLPSIANQIMELTADPYASALELAQVIRSDPALTTKILKIVNSAFYGFHRQVDSIENAVMILGNDEVANLAFTVAIARILEKVPAAQGRELWAHSLMVALLSQWLGQRLGLEDVESLYTAGLLHDLGKLVLWQAGLQPTLEAASLTSLAGEEQVIGFSHAEMGGYIAERWNLPEKVVDSLMHHHLPAKALNREQASLLNLADLLAHNRSLDNLSHASSVYLCSSGLNLDDDEVRLTCARLREKVELMLEI